MGKLFLDAEKVFHLAALADIVPSIEKPDEYFRANVDGTFNVLEAVGVQNNQVNIPTSGFYGILKISNR